MSHFKRGNLPNPPVLVQVEQGLKFFVVSKTLIKPYADLTYDYDN